MRRTFLVVGVLAAVGCSAPPAPVPDAVVPPRPADGGGVVHGGIETFAIDSILLGETDRAGTPSVNAWKTYGYDLDGLVTDEESTNVCTLFTGAPRSNQTDGDSGIDNAAGLALVPVLETAEQNPSPSETETSEIRGGAWTLLIELDGFGTASNVVGIGAQVFTGGPFEQGTPAFDASTDWPVLASSLQDGAAVASGARVRFDDAYVTADGTFVSGVSSDEPIVLPLAFPSAPTWPLVLRVHRPVFTFARDPADPAHLVNGTIAGVLDTIELVDAVRLHAQASQPAFCGDFGGIADQLRQAQDILRDGTNAPGVPCDAVSIGIGFTARRVANPTRVVADPSPPSVCGASDAGGGGVDAGAADAGAADSAADATDATAD